MKLYWLGIGLLLIGCQKKENQALAAAAVTSTTQTTSQGVYAIVGQSNSAYMGQRQAEHIRQALGAVAVVNCGVPSTPMSRWTRNGDLYLGCVEQIKAAIAANPGSTLKGIMFWQGESDCNDQDVSLWAGRFRAMVEGYRSIWANAPIAFAQIADTHTDHRDEMRTYQAGIYISGVTMIKTDGIVQDGDHTNDAGYAIMADRFVQAFR